MAQLAPAVCPVCDLRYSECSEDPDLIGRFRYFHFSAHRMCVIEEGREHIQVELKPGGFIPRDVGK